VKSEGEIVIRPGGKEHTGRRAAYSIRSDQGPARSELYLFMHHRNFIKYRITYPEAALGPAPTAVTQLVSALAWP